MSNARQLEFQLDRILNETYIQLLDFHQVIPSTNDRAMKLAADATLPRPLAVLSETQSRGRGRGSNQWWSTEGSLTFSLLTELENLPGERIPQLSLTAGLALCQAIESIAPLADIALKWPNDIFLDGKKLAGILIELPPNAPPQAVIGIGINVNNRFQAAPTDVQDKATSLSDCLGTDFEITDVLIGCLQSLEQRLKSFHDCSTSLAEQWRTYHLLQDMDVEIEVCSRKVSGICAGIDDDGALLLETPNGIERFLGGVITQFRSANR
ncbi:MAG: biotin--[acetyl-CoA-carboxylase] ligase [Pirellulaceae bacterium]|nr:biotin--[acetyl-CoA-carboxylase] ligase [Pirellulaceae bacterium]